VTASRATRWMDAWRRIGAAPPPSLRADLLARYAEPHRAYHTVQHLDECLAALVPAAHLAQRLGEVELALWFHDAIYDPRADDNEERSAHWAEHAVIDAGADRDAAARVAELVLATKHDAAPPPGDATLVVDVDLAILGADEARFAEYERQVRQEYAWMPDAAFRRGRAQVLASFLARPSIYGTRWFAERLEDRARANLQRSLDALAG
jgi:predicted metal-dependent HD superfamily phosphohydrolase